MPHVQEWATFPFDGEIRVRTLLPPIDVEAPRQGGGGAECAACARGDDGCMWTDERWRLFHLGRPSGLPVVLILEPRAHYAEPGDLPVDVAAELGIMLARVERAVRAVPHVGRVHVCRWGDGAEHMHWWFMARPARIPQLLGSFAAMWDEVLPPMPEAIWLENMVIVKRELDRAD
jgi:diadenosine tetraphosphate (Ap4A) HIT family hydrolase